MAGPAEQAVGRRATELLKTKFPDGQDTSRCSSMPRTAGKGARIRSATAPRSSSPAGGRFSGTSAAARSPRWRSTTTSPTASGGRETARPSRNCGRRSTPYPAWCGAHRPRMDRWYWSTRAGRIWAGRLPKSRRSMAVRRASRRCAAARRGMVESLATGKPFEAVCRVRSGRASIARLLARAAPLRDENGRILRWYGINTDIEDRRRAEDALHKAQAELAHVTRVTTLGELAASIAHEVNQPLAAVVTNGEACLRWLLRDVPDLEEVRSSVERMISDGRRASQVVARLRALVRKGESQAEQAEHERNSRRCAPARRAGIGRAAGRSATRSGAFAAGRSGRPCPVAAGHHQSGDECHPGDVWRHRPAAGALHQLQKSGAGTAAGP